jgi:hypothetical protein
MRRKNITTNKEKKKMGKMANLVDEYNRMVVEFNLNRSTVKKFSSIKAGEKRILGLRAAIESNSRQNGKEANLPETNIESDDPTIIIKKRKEAEKKAEEKEVKAKDPGPGKGHTVNPSTAVKPVHQAWLIRLAMLKENPETTRKEFMAACLAKGINKGTAGANWSSLDEETIIARLKKAGAL